MIKKFFKIHKIQINLQSKDSPPAGAKGSPPSGANAKPDAATTKKAENKKSQFVAFRSR